MPDRAFYSKPIPMDASEIENHVLIQDIVHRPSSSLSIEDVNSLQNGRAGDIVFCQHIGHAKKYLPNIGATAAFITKDMISLLPESVTGYVVSSPMESFAKIASLLYPCTECVAVIPGNATVGKNVQCGEGVIIGEGAIIEDDVSIGSYTVIGPGVRIGKGTRIHSHVHISHAYIGAKVVIKSSAVIGGEGFGFFMEEDKYVTFPQLGRVIIEDYVHIGAQTAIDRGSLSDTLIKRNARIDNLVQIAHNVSIGANAVIVAQVGIAGSSSVGTNSVIAGQVGIADNISVGSNVKVGAQSGIMRDVEDSTIVAGTPAVSLVQWKKQCIMLSKLVRKKEK